MQYKMEGYSSKKMSYTDARRVKEIETKRKPKVCSRFVLTIFSNRIVTAQAGIPKLSANTCFKLVLRMLAIDETESCLGGLMLETICPPKSPTPSAQLVKKKSDIEGVMERKYERKSPIQNRR